MGLFPDRSVQRKAKDKQLMMCHPLGHPPVSSCAVLRMQAEKESRVKEAKREVSRIQMEAEARKQELVREAAAQKRAAEAARREEQARLALERNLELQRQWRESEALKQVRPPLCELYIMPVTVAKSQGCRVKQAQALCTPYA